MERKSKQLLEELEEAMRFHGDAGHAIPMARYMQDQFAFMGIKQPLRKELSREFLHTAKQLEGKEIITICDHLWKLQEREFQYIALELLYACRKKWDEKFLQFFTAIVKRKAWWDTIDFIATKLFGGYYAQTKKPTQMKAWCNSIDLWENRVAILFQLNYKEKTDAEFLFSVINKLKSKKEFFIQKAIGWSLRQYFRTNPKAVKAFIVSAGIEGLAKREALKHSL
jgi:3-methyladenine DNA glycosylase AlkD